MISWITCKILQKFLYHYQLFIEEKYTKKSPVIYKISFVITVDMILTSFYM